MSLFYVNTYNTAAALQNPPVVLVFNKCNLLGRVMCGISNHRPSLCSSSPVSRAVDCLKYGELLGTGT